MNSPTPPPDHGHRSFAVDLPNGVTGRITGDPNMPEATQGALLRMMQLLADQPPAARLTQCQAIADCLVRAGGAWVPMPYLAQISESLNVHSRVDELRHKHGMTIENKKVPHPSIPRRLHSYYRIPLPAPTPAADA